MFNLFCFDSASFSTQKIDIFLIFCVVQFSKSSANWNHLHHYLFLAVSIYFIFSSCELLDRDWQYRLWISFKAYFLSLCRGFHYLCCFFYSECSFIWSLLLKNLIIYPAYELGFSFKTRIHRNCFWTIDSRWRTLQGDSIQQFVCGSIYSLMKECFEFSFGNILSILMCTSSAQYVNSWAKICTFQSLYRLFLLSFINKKENTCLWWNGKMDLNSKFTVWNHRQVFRYQNIRS